jgi:CDP-diacylglycerol--serine O-phosphatidyltransferase
MVSSIKYYSFKDLNFFARKPFMSFVLILLILVIVIAETQIMIFTFSFGYALSGPAWLVYKLIRKRGTAQEQKAHHSEETKLSCK